MNMLDGVAIDSHDKINVSIRGKRIDMEALQFEDCQRLFYRNERLFVDLRKRLAILDGQVLALTRKEYGLLALLVEHAGEVVLRAILMTHIWGYVAKTRTRTLDVHIGRLRKKLGPEGERIQTIFGKGYSFDHPRMACLEQRAAEARCE